MLQPRSTSLCIGWGGAAGEAALKWQGQYEGQRKRLINRLFPDTADDVITLCCGTGSGQVTALAKHFQPGGDWGATLNSIASAERQGEVRTRRARLRAQATDAPRIG